MNKIYIIVILSSALTYLTVQQNSCKPISGNEITKIEELQSSLEQILNTKTEIFPEEGVIKVNFPRNDIKVSIDNWPLNPFMGLTSWISFQKGSKKGIEIMAMGDLVLLEEEVNPAMSTALENGIQITALHNHFFYDSPKVYFMHLEAEGKTSDIANGINKIFHAVKNLERKTKSPLPTTHAIHGERLEKIIMVKGTAKDGMFKFVIGRKIKASCGCAVGKNMGINTWAAFGGTDDNAIVYGDFAILEHELQPVLKTLRSANINVVAIHNHMTNENPRMLFLHFWGHGKAIDLAQGIKKALDKTSTL